MMITCKQTSELMSQGQDRELGLVERLRLRLHLLICKRCRRVEQQFGLLRAAIRRCRDDG
jgi:hypothetical protein